MATAPALPPGAHLSDNAGPAFYRYCIGMLTIMGVAVVLRFWQRLLINPNRGPRLWWDDWTCLIGLVGCAFYIAIQMHITKLGVGRHLAAIPPENLILMGKWTFVIHFIYQYAISSVKCSALLFYTRVFNIRHGRTRYAIWITHACVWAWATFLTILAICICSPIKRFWDPTVPGRCLDHSFTYVLTTSLAVAVDLMILVLPMHLIWKLQLAISQKVAIMIFFCLGYSVVVVSVGRVVALYRLGNKMNTDFTYVSASLFYWYVAEMAITILGICLPSIFNLANRYMRGGSQALMNRSFDVPPKNMRSWKSSRTGSQKGSRKDSHKGSLLHTHSRATTLHDRTLKDDASATTEEQQLCYQETICTTDNSDWPINPNAPDQKVHVKVDIETSSDTYDPERYAPPKTPWD